MLLHYSTRDYEEAASDAASRARGKLESRIQIGRVSGERILQKVMTEIPEDRLVNGRAVQFGVSPAEDLVMRLSEGASLECHQVHKHAMSQACSRIGLPIRYAGDLQNLGYWGNDLLAHNLNELYSRKHAQLPEDKRYLVRSYSSQVRGFLSDRYRRMDSRPLLDAFAGACSEVGALPIEGYGSDTKVAIKAVLPMVFEPVPNECLSIGIMWENSDYGNGKHAIHAFIDRLWCTNYAIMTTGFANVHLGKRLSDDVIYSQQTYELDTKTIASAIRDVVEQTMSPRSAQRLCEVVKQAHEQEIQPDKALAAIGKKLSKGESQAVVEKYNTPDVEMLPPGNNVWRMSNALSWVAQGTEDEERKVELMKIAGEILPKVA